MPPNSNNRRRKNAEYPGLDALLERGVKTGKFEETIRETGGGVPRELSLLDVPFTSSLPHAQHHIERYGLLFAEEFDVPQARAVARNAFNFARVVGSQAVGPSADVNLAALPGLDIDGDLQRARDEHYETVTAYLSDRTATDKIIMTYIDMDPLTSEMPLIGKVAAGATFLCMDLAAQQSFNLKYPKPPIT